MVDGSITKTKVTDPLPFYKAYWTVGRSDKLAVAKGWDYFIVGTTQSLSYPGKTITFGGWSIGFAMALEKNRRTSIINGGTAPLFSQQLPTATILPLASGYAF